MVYHPNSLPVVEASSTFEPGNMLFCRKQSKKKHCGRSSESHYNCLYARKPQCRIPNAFPLKLLLFHHLIQANTNTGRKKAYRFVPLCRYILFCLFHFGSLASKYVLSVRQTFQFTSCFSLG